MKSKLTRTNYLPNSNNMNKKFPYGYDVNVYIDKAFEQMKELYPWAEKNMLRKQWSYAIEKNDHGEYAFVTYFKWSEKDIERTALDCDSEGFIELFINHHSDWIEMENPVKDVMNVRNLIPGGTMIRGWYIESYEFRSHVKGGYSVFLQAGDRTAGASRTIFIPPAYFKLSWDEFLEKYEELVSPNAFYLGKEELENAPGLKEFLGF